MNYIYYGIEENKYSLSHHGIKGQKWGVRRWQNSDGSLTPEGYAHYGRGLPKAIKNHKANVINRNAKRIAKGNYKLDKLNKEYLNDQRREANAEMDYAKAADKLDTTKQKLDRAQNGFSAKLFGEDHYKVNKLNKQIDKQTRELISARDEYNKAKAYKYDTEVSLKEMRDKINRTTNKRNRDINKFINKYGMEEYSKLVKE